MFLIVLSMKMKQLSSAHGYVFKYHFNSPKFDIYKKNLHLRVWTTNSFHSLV